MSTPRTPAPASSGAAAWGSQTALGALIRRQRQLADIPMKQFAAMVGISNPYLSQIETGLRDPSTEVLEAIALSLGVEVARLVAENPSSHSRTSRDEGGHETDTSRRVAPSTDTPGQAADVEPDEFPDPGPPSDEQAQVAATGIENASVQAQASALIAGIRAQDALTSAQKAALTETFLAMAASTDAKRRRRGRTVP